MNADILAKACAKLKWSYEVKVERGQSVLYVYALSHQRGLVREFDLKVVGNQVTFNRYYLKDGRTLARELEKKIHEVNVEYARETILAEFKAVGFKELPDYKFVPNEKEKVRFKMVGQSKIAAETEKRTEIEFTILNDGTIVSDSNYIPGDVHELADKAMEGIDHAFGTTRKEGEHIQRKEIPLKYKNKAYCKASNKIVAKY